MEEQNQQEILQDSLFKHCAQGDTGTVFISTANNKSCQIVITNGKIMAVSLARTKGFEAILEMEKVGIKAATYTEEMQLNYTDDAIIDSSEAVLKLLGYSKSTIENKGEVEDFSESTDSPETEATDKPVRMYRGQIIDD